MWRFGLHLPSAICIWTRQHLTWATLVEARGRLCLQSHSMRPTQTFNTYTNTDTSYSISRCTHLTSSLKAYHSFRPQAVLCQPRLCSTRPGRDERDFLHLELRSELHIRVFPQSIPDVSAARERRRRNYPVIQVVGSCEFCAFCLVAGSRLWKHHRREAAVDLPEARHCKQAPAISLWVHAKIERFWDLSIPGAKPPKCSDAGQDLGEFATLVVVQGDPRLFLKLEPRLHGKFP